MIPPAWKGLQTSSGGNHARGKDKRAGDLRVAAWRRTAVLERCLRRLEWDRVKEAEAKAAADQFEAERLAMQSIDWCVLDLSDAAASPRWHAPRHSSRAL